MPSFAPRSIPVKKYEILNYKIYEFLECIDKKCSQEKLAIKAENVKIAQLNLLKARLTSNRSYSASDISKKQITLNKKIQNEILVWETKSYSEIEDFCKHSA